MKCEYVDENVIDYLDNSLDDNLRQEIERHLETCERCLDNVRETQQVLELISKDEMIKPEDSMRINFYHMLHGEIKKQESHTHLVTKKSQIWYGNKMFRIAAGVALLICGTLIGTFIGSAIRNSHTSVELAQLESEVTTLKKTAIFTMLKDESSSYRIQAVNYADEISNPDAGVIDVLVKTLNNDKNVNVRMAAAYALSKFADQKAVTDSLVKSLSQQVDPILQVTLINILVERKEKSALKPIQQIINNKSTLDAVKAVAENGERVLL